MRIFPEGELMKQSFLLWDWKHEQTDRAMSMMETAGILASIFTPPIRRIEDPSVSLRIDTRNRGTDMLECEDFPIGLKHFSEGDAHILDFNTQCFQLFGDSITIGASPAGL